MAVIRFTVFSSSKFVKFVVVERLKQEEEEEASSCISSVAINQ